LRVLAIVLSVSVGAVPGEAAGQSDSAPAAVAVHLFWSTGCPHCAKARRFLTDVASRESRIRLREYEVSTSAEGEALFQRVTAAFAIKVPAVPLVIVGDRAFVGYMDDQSTGRAIRDAIFACYATNCPDIVAFLERQMSSEKAPAAQREATTSSRAPPLPETIRIPLVGEVSTSALSLPALTLLLAAVDGFNPCAMWVLVFLIGLLLGMTDHVRMWALGGAFLAASAAVYLVFMAAWLNLLLFLGALVWIRLAIGIVALAGGAYYVSEYVRNPAGLCKVTAADQRQRVMDRIRETVRQRNFLLSLGGIVAVAMAVNLVELLCSAGIPAIYTQVLALSALPDWQYHLYLLLYIFVFLLDDLAVFVTAMVTLQASGLTARYARYSHLIGGIVLVGLGILLLFRPEWLKFGV
jgi:glutaredoxin